MPIKKLNSLQAVAMTLSGKHDSLWGYQMPLYSTYPGDENFTRDELILIVELAYTLYEETGLAPTLPQIKKNLYRSNPVPSDEAIAGMLKSEMFKTACNYRGIPQSKDGLDARQMLALKAATNQLSNMKLETKLRRIGVTDREFKAWLRYPPFKKKYDELAANALQEAESSGDVALAQQVTQGRLDAIKYADLRSGRYDPGRQQFVDVEYVIRQTIEIIQKHVKDPQALRSIGGELSLLAGAAGLDPGSSSSNDEREVPEDGNQLYP